MKKQIVILCIGTSKISGDSLAPNVGSLLQDKYKLPCFIYGTTEKNVHSKNINDYLDFINSVHSNCILITIDSTLSKKEIGTIVINDGIKPGGAVNKNAKKIGDIGIAGVVEKPTKKVLQALLSVPFYQILATADSISKIVFSAITAYMANQETI